METKFICMVSFDDKLNASMLIQKVSVVDGEEFRKNWRTIFMRGVPLGDSLPTVWGNLPWSDFPSERDYILAKWAEIQE